MLCLSEPQYNKPGREFQAKQGERREFIPKKVKKSIDTGWDIHYNSTYL